MGVSATRSQRVSAAFIASAGKPIIRYTFWTNTSGPTPYFPESCLSRKNERKQVLENLHRKVNELKHLQAQNPFADDPTDLPLLGPSLKKGWMNKILRLEAQIYLYFENTERFF
ncbi:uncharacterized protein PHALS_01133 [Plasmopara halstedii]|uniref:Uncharacterized protein n=1 Tax=Plasmopara halstedii TaxID=4781 RepID=A0A0P1AW78_PLAHL|nr:uncharacterized protein PHALS_01133 [Plasmopara halstedii]CEG44797.1 hypothetical protein PHALS_01133 [Plasmopara halstedii]|eukprot:XP_024581166.1 hypothetical protein PHALS_01133 [Plasmopara halstedii]